MKILRLFSLLVVTSLIFASCDEEKKDEGSPLYDGEYEVTVYNTESPINPVVDLTITNGIITGVGEDSYMKVTVTGKVDADGTFTGTATYIPKYGGGSTTSTLTGEIDNEDISGAWVEADGDTGYFSGYQTSTPNTSETSSKYDGTWNFSYYNQSTGKDGSFSFTLSNGLYTEEGLTISLKETSSGYVAITMVTDSGTLTFSGSATTSYMSGNYTSTEGGYGTWSSIKSSTYSKAAKFKVSKSLDDAVQ